MAIIRTKELHKMSTEERNAKLKDLQFELTKSYVTANKQKAKTKEIKRVIARILTINTSARASAPPAQKKSVPVTEKKTRKGVLKQK